MVGGVTLRPYVTPNFWTPLGAAAKLRALEKKGFPKNLRNWRFVTLTLDRAPYPTPEDAYEDGLSRLSRFARNLRRAGYAVARWCWKMEFHRPDEDGDVYPHWHVLLDYKRPIPVDAIDGAWGKGRTEIKGVTDAGFKYLFKYVAKSIASVPDWILERRNVRLFQTSPGFFSTNDEAAMVVRASLRPCSEEPGANTQNERVITTVGERLERWSRLVVSRSISDTGNVIHRVHSLGEKTWGKLRLHFCQLQFALKLGEKNMQISTYKIETTWLHLHHSIPQT
jgi:hypothetical protein